jgi:OOP family OmpA-OmpF porin
MNRRKTLLAVTAAVATLAGSGVGHEALAQNIPPSATGPVRTVQGFDLDTFHAAERGSDWFSSDSLDFRGNLRPAVGITPEAALKPLAVPTPGGHTTVVADQLVTHISGSVNLADSVRVGVTVPLYITQSGHNGIDREGNRYSSPSQTNIGDSRFSFDIRLLGHYGDAFQLAIGAQLFAPTGAPSQYTGAPTSRGNLRLSTAGDVGAIAYAVQTGILLRDGNINYAGQWIGDDWNWNGSIGLRFGNRKFLIGPEFYGSTIISKAHFFARNETPLEVIGGIHWMFHDDWRVGAGAGPGLSPAYGSPDVRLLTSVEWVPHYEAPKAAGDRDGDGVKDDRDACPDVPGVKTENPHNNGCPLADQDGDGVPDTVDACPTVPGTKTDDPTTNGCPTDKDGDGIADNVDACPDVAGVANADPAKNGCPADRDGDGIADAVDACPDKPGPKSDDPKKNGCPADADGDGINDDVDACPNEPGPANPDPKKNGCPRARLENGEVKITEQVRFKTGSAVILADSNELLADVARVIGEHKEIARIRVEGHTDNTGSAATNRKLSAQRAAAVSTWLALHGIDKSRLTSQGYGPDRPIESNSTAEGRAANRRVEFHVEGPNDAPPPPAPPAPPKKHR